MMVRQHQGVVPRALADDLSLWARQATDAASRGTDLWIKNWETAMDATLQLFDDMGAKVAHGKCLTLASNTPLRKWLRQKRGGRLQAAIPTVGWAHNLGAPVQ